MAKFTLNIEEDYDFSIIGISCHAKDYRLCYELNQLFEADFVRTDDIEINIKKSMGKFSIFEYHNEENYLSYFLISNRSDQGFLIPEYKTIDFFLMLKGAINTKLIGGMVEKICSSQLILTAYFIEVSTLKSKQNFLF